MEQKYAEWYLEWKGYFVQHHDTLLLIEEYIPNTTPAERTYRLTFNEKGELHVNSRALPWSKCDFKKLQRAVKQANLVMGLIYKFPLIAAFQIAEFL